MKHTQAEVSELALALCIKSRIASGQPALEACTAVLGKERVQEIFATFSGVAKENA